MGDGREEGPGVRRPAGDAALRFIGSIRFRLLSNSSTPGLNGRLREAEPEGGEGRLPDVETDPRWEMAGRGDVAVCRLPFDNVGDCIGPP
jgi:hypothetical protein